MTSASCQCSRDCLGWERRVGTGAQVQFFDSVVVIDFKVESKPGVSRKQSCLIFEMSNVHSNTVASVWFLRPSIILTGRTHGRGKIHKHPIPKDCNPWKSIRTYEPIYNMTYYVEVEVAVGLQTEAYAYNISKRHLSLFLSFVCYTLLYKVRLCPCACACVHVCVCVCVHVCLWVCDGLCVCVRLLLHVQMRIIA